MSRRRVFVMVSSPISPALLAAGFVGTWDTDVPSALSVLDEGAARLLAGDVALAGQPLPLEIALQRTHPADRSWLFERIRRVRSTGGPVSAEFRVFDENDDVRWVLNRGGLAPDADGVMRGRGMYIDTTDSHSSAFYPINPIKLPVTDPLIVAADRSLEAHAAIERMGHEGLRIISDVLLMEIGRLLARREQA